MRVGARLDIQGTYTHEGTCMHGVRTLSTCSRARMRRAWFVPTHGSPQSSASMRPWSCSSGSSVQAKKTLI